jgi:hypothetical protein
VAAQWVHIGHCCNHPALLLLLVVVRVTLPEALALLLLPLGLQLAVLLHTFSPLSLQSDWHQLQHPVLALPLLLLVLMPLLVLLLVLTSQRAAAHWAAELQHPHPNAPVGCAAAAAVPVPEQPHLGLQPLLVQPPPHLLVHTTLLSLAWTQTLRMLLLLVVG